MHKQLLPYYLLLFILIFLSLSVTGCDLIFLGEPEESIPPLISEPPPAEAYQNLDALTAVTIPERDLTDLTQRFKGLDDLPTTLSLVEYEVGDTAPFWYKNDDDDENVQIEAELLYRSDQLNLWFEIGQTVETDTLQEAAAILEQQILPTNRAFFGQEWQPGIDGDDRVNILHLADLGGGVIGYFSEADEFVTAVNSFSNQRELMYISLKYAPVGSHAYYGVIAHEMQHMIHWHIDGNEATWLNEGLSELAAFLNGYGEPDLAGHYAALPDVQLNNFEYDSAAVGAHYDSAFLLTAYFLDQYGEEATRNLVSHPENSLASFELALAELGAEGSFDDFFAQWVVANYLDSVSAAPTPYRYDNLDLPPLELTAELNAFPAEAEAVVKQYGADFIQVQAEQPLTFVFTGTQQVQLIQTTPHSGQYFWTSYPVDDSDVYLTREFDLRALEEATLTFWTWYDLETNWDYGYVAISTDNGRHWQPLTSASTTLDNPQGNSYGPAYTGLSGGDEEPVWIQESVDLTPFAGQRVQLRFEVITDDAVHQQGFALDDIVIPELNYSEDFEDGAGGWQAAGFVRHTNILPQSFIVQRILLGPEIEVERLVVGEAQNGRWTLPLNPQATEAILIISGTTPVTSQPAAYRYRLVLATE